MKTLTSDEVNYKVNKKIQSFIDQEKKKNQKNQKTKNIQKTKKTKSVKEQGVKKTKSVKEQEDKKIQKMKERERKNQISKLLKKHKLIFPVDEDDLLRIEPNKVLVPSENLILLRELEKLYKKYLLYLKKPHTELDYFIYYINLSEDILNSYDKRTKSKEKGEMYVYKIYEKNDNELTLTNGILYILPNIHKSIIDNTTDLIKKSYEYITKYINRPKKKTYEYDTYSKKWGYHSDDKDVDSLMTYKDIGYSYLNMFLNNNEVPFNFDIDKYFNIIKNRIFEKDKTLDTLKFIKSIDGILKPITPDYENMLVFRGIREHNTFDYKYSYQRNLIKKISNYVSCTQSIDVAMHFANKTGMVLAFKLVPGLNIYDYDNYSLTLNEKKDREREILIQRNIYLKINLIVGKIIFCDIIDFEKYKPKKELKDKMINLKYDILKMFNTNSDEQNNYLKNVNLYLKKHDHSKTTPEYIFGNFIIANKINIKNMPPDVMENKYNLFMNEIKRLKIKTAPKSDKPNALKYYDRY